MDAEKLPDKLTLRPSRMKWLLILAGGLAFVAIAVWVPTEGDNLWRWFVGGIFGLLSVVALPGALGLGSQLELRQSEFICTTLFRTWKRRWDDCSEFTPIQLGPNTFVGFSTKAEEAKHPQLSAMNRAVAGTSAMLPDTYGMNPEALAELMNAFRARALGAQ